MVRWYEAVDVAKVARFGRFILGVGRSVPLKVRKPSRDWFLFVLRRIPCSDRILLALETRVSGIGRR